jgi:CheY-like chemotaxis protein
MIDATTQARKPRVLVLDDDPRLLQACLRMLSRWGYCCVAYSDVHGALAAIARNPPDLLILDIYMPVLDGFEVLARVRRLAPTTRILAISGDVICARDTHLLPISALLGADATLRKPINPHRFRATMRQLLPPAAAALRGSTR